MEKKLLQKMVEWTILNILKKYDCINDEFVRFYFDKVCNSEKEIELILEMAQQSKLYNYIKINNFGFYVNKNKKDLKRLFLKLGLSKNSPNLPHYVYCGSESILAKEVFD